MKRAAALLLAVLAAQGCDESDRPEKKRARAKDEKPKASDIVAVCADAFGADPLSQGEPNPDFLDCLKRNDAPQDVIDAWTEPLPR